MYKIHLFYEIFNLTKALTKTFSIDSGDDSVFLSNVDDDYDPHYESLKFGSLKENDYSVVNRAPRPPNRTTSAHNTLHKNEPDYDLVYEKIILVEKGQITMENKSRSETDDYATIKFNNNDYAVIL
jgi:hypothetical protein